MWGARIPAVTLTLDDRVQRWPAPEGSARQADAEKRPCELHTYHSPVVVRTQGHHVFPVYLQMRLWQELRLQELLWICGTGHDSLHAWLPWALTETRNRPLVRSGARTMDQVERVVEWYRSLT